MIVPRDFGLRYIAWLLWTNGLTILCTVQLIFVQLASDSSVPVVWVKWLLSGSSILGILIAQLKRINPPPRSPPRKRKVIYG